MTNLITIENQTYKDFAFYSTICIIKLFFVALMTGISRRRKVIFVLKFITFKLGLKLLNNLLNVFNIKYYIVIFN